MSNAEIADYLRSTFAENPLLVFTAVNNGTPDRPSNRDIYHWGFLDGTVIGDAIDWDAEGFMPKPMISSTPILIAISGPLTSLPGSEALYNYTYDILYGGERLYDGFGSAWVLLHL